MEFLPRTGREDAVTTALVRAVLRQHGERPIVLAVADYVDPSELSDFGLANHGTSIVGGRQGRRAFGVRLFDPSGTDWVLDGTDVRNPDNWLTGYGGIGVGCSTLSLRTSVDHSENVNHRIPVDGFCH